MKNAFCKATNSTYRPTYAFIDMKASCASITTQLICRWKVISLGLTSISALILVECTFAPRKIIGTIVFLLVIL
eukprot:UN03502